MSEEAHTKAAKVAKAHVCPKCHHFIGLPQDHAYSCPHWHFVGRYQPPGKYPAAEPDDPPEVGHL
jgi:hypothetical protein